MSASKAAEMRRKAFSQLREAASLLTTAFGLLADCEMVNEQPSERVDEPQAAPATRTAAASAQPTNVKDVANEDNNASRETEPTLDDDESVSDVPLTKLSKLRSAKEKILKKPPPRPSDEMDVEADPMEEADLSSEIMEVVEKKKNRLRSSASKDSAPGNLNKTLDFSANPDKSTSDGTEAMEIADDDETNTSAPPAKKKASASAKKHRETAAAKTPEPAAQPKGKRLSKTATKKSAKKQPASKQVDANVTTVAKSSSASKRATRKSAAKVTVPVENKDDDGTSVAAQGDGSTAGGTVAEKATVVKSSSRSKRVAKKSPPKKPASVVEKEVNVPDDEHEVEEETPAATKSSAQSKRSTKRSTAKKSSTTTASTSAQTQTSKEDESDSDSEFVPPVKSSSTSKRERKKASAAEKNVSSVGKENEDVGNTVEPPKGRKGIARKMLSSSKLSNSKKNTVETEIRDDDVETVEDPIPSKEDATEGSTHEAMKTPPPATTAPANGKAAIVNEESDAEFEDISVDADGSGSEGDSYLSDDEAVNELAQERKKDGEELDKITAELEPEEDVEGEGSKNEKKPEPVEDDVEDEKENVEERRFNAKGKVAKKAAATTKRASVAGKKRKAAESENVSATPLKKGKRKIPDENIVDKLTIDILTSNTGMTKKRFLELIKETDNVDISQQQFLKSFARLLEKGTIESIGRNKGYKVS